MHRVLVPLLLGALTLGACGSEGGSPAPKPGPAGASLRVEVQPDGPGGPVRRRSIECRTLGAGAGEPICRRLARLDRRELAPVPSGSACTQLYGGPAVASVSGTLRGRELRARFELRNGCEIARWRRNALLLGAPPGRSGAAR
jgi:hypothetical protein